jgi:hypothetical protein
MLHFTQERISGQNVQKIDIARRESVEHDEARHSLPVANFWRKIPENRAGKQHIRSGKVGYAIMSFGGFMGIGEEFYPTR